MLTKDRKELIRKFNAQGVEYLLVGGYASVSTLSPAQPKTSTCSSGPAPGIAMLYSVPCANMAHPLARLTAKDFRDAKTGLQLGVPPNRIDILQQISGVTFDEAWKDRVNAMIEGDTPTYVISRQNLIKNKLAAGREQDLLDVKQIQKAAAYAPQQPTPKIAKPVRKKKRPKGSQH